MDMPDIDEPWPHQFTKNGRGYEMPDGSYAQTYICIHCYREYVRQFETPEWVKGSCPARNTKREIKRMIS